MRSSVFSILLTASVFFSLGAPAPALASETEPSPGGRFSILAKPFGANLQSGVVGCCAALTPGIAVELKLDSGSRMLFEIERPIFNTSYDNAGNRHLDGLNFGIQYKYFVRSTLYLKGGLSQRSVVYSYRTDTDSSDFDGKSTAAMIAFGNQWSSSQNIVLGIDWIGYAIPILTSLSGESLSGSNPVDTQTRMNRVKDATLTDRAYFGLNVYVGISF